VLHETRAFQIRRAASGLGIEQRLFDNLAGQARLAAGCGQIDATGIHTRHPRTGKAAFLSSLPWHAVC
jgi:hypothetical protein